MYKMEALDGLEIMESSLCLTLGKRRLHDGKEASDDQDLGCNAEKSLRLLLAKPSVCICVSLLLAMNLKSLPRRECLGRPVGGGRFGLRSRSKSKSRFPLRRGLV